MVRGLARDHDEKRQALRRGAAQYFARNGFDRASMTGAARECGVSKALLYHYHDSKEALLYDILDGHLSDLLDTVERAAPQGLTALIAAILEAYEDADAEHKLQLEALRSALPPEMQAPLIAIQRRLVALMAEALQAERPDLTDRRLHAATMTVFGILNWFYMWQPQATPDDRREYARLVTNLTLNGCSAI